MPRATIRFPEDLYRAISAEAERRGKPWTFSSVLIELAQRPDPSPWHPLDTDRVHNVMHYGLSAIVGPRDMGGDDPISEAYRAGGGGYDGLQAVARWTLDAVEAIKASGALESMPGAARDGSNIATVEAVGSLPQASASTRTPSPPWHGCLSCGERRDRLPLPGCAGPSWHTSATRIPPHDPAATETKRIG